MTDSGLTHALQMISSQSSLRWGKDVSEAVCDKAVSGGGSWEHRPCPDHARDMAKPLPEFIRVDAVLASLGDTFPVPEQKLA